MRTEIIVSEPRRVFVYVFAGQLLFLAARASTVPFRGFGNLALGGLSAIAMALVLTSVFVLPALVVASLLKRNGLWKLAIAVVTGAVLLLVAADYLLLLIPQVYDRWDVCLAPGVVIDGRCEVGPL